MCPHNPELIAFVNNADIWVTHLVSRCEQRLTFCHNASAGGVADDPLSAGLPCYVMQEEFNRLVRNSRDKEMLEKNILQSYFLCLAI